MALYHYNEYHKYKEKYVNESQIIEIKKLVNDAKIPGFIMAKIHNKKNVWIESAGVLKIGSDKKVDENTIFHAASLGKPVFAYAVLKMVERGEFDLDEPLFNHFILDGIDKDKRYKKITGRMALSHSSGLPNKGDPIIQFDPGTQFTYSGIGYLYLQKVIEKIYGKKLNKIMEKEVFAPLNMTNTSYIWKSEYDGVAAHPHDIFGRSFKINKFKDAFAHNTMLTTVGDYSKFLIAISGDDYIKENMMTSQIRINEKLSWGIGFGIIRNMIFQWGSKDGHRSFVIFDCIEGSGYVFFANSSNGLSILDDVNKLFNVEFNKSEIFQQLSG